MSYLNTLNRAVKSPATDYHFLIIEEPSRRNEYYGFFTGNEVSGILSEMERLDAENASLEKKYNNNLEKPVNILPQDEPDYEKWSKNNQLWSKYHDSYYKELEKAKIFIKAGVSEPKKLTTEQEVIKKGFIKENSADKSIQNNGVDFLMSIAGMFDSGDKNGSENIKSVVSEAILKKYGKR